MTVAASSSFSEIYHGFFKARRFADRVFPGFKLTILGGALLLLIPLVSIIMLGLSDWSRWPHIQAYVLPNALWQTAWLVLGLSLFTALLGVFTAWLAGNFSFPGRNIFNWALVLPLAMPGYISAFSYVELFDAVGPVQNGLRALLGVKQVSDFVFYDIRSLPGAIFILGVVLYPYVYLTGRASLSLKSHCHIECARSLGASPFTLFFKVGLPLMRPAIVIGVLLVIMEGLNDIGAMEILGVRSLTFAVYETWLNRGSLAGASQLALLLLFLVLFLAMTERKMRGQRSFYGQPTPIVGESLKRLTGWHKYAASFFCFLPIFFGILLPIIPLVIPALLAFGEGVGENIAWAALTSVVLAFITAILTVGIAIVLCFGVRRSRARSIGLMAEIASFGYAIPGTILAIGIFIPIAWLDGQIADFSRWLTGSSPGLLITASGVLLVYAYAVRFMAMAFGTLASGYARLLPNIDAAGKMLGASDKAMLVRLHYPLLRPVIFTAGLLVFIEVMKELSATILLRPFNVETLATLVYQAALREDFDAGALPALVIALVGMIPVILISRMTGGADNKS